MSHDCKHLLVVQVTNNIHKGPKDAEAYAIKHLDRQLLLVHIKNKQKGFFAPLRPSCN